MKDNLKPIELAYQLWPICRSITGQGVRDTLKIIDNNIGCLKIKGIRSGTKVFDWKIPDEWNIQDAWVKNQRGQKLIDFKKNNLHIVGYSMPKNGWIEKEELSKKLYSLKEQPNAIPYITSYYKKDWGFCVTERERVEIMEEGDTFEICIDSSFNKDGELNYGEALIKGESRKEIFISTYICHPSMANNEISGPVVATYLAKWVKQQKNRKYTYRFIFIPETIGSIAYINKNRRILQKRVKAGFNLTCIGDNENYSYLPTKYKDSYSDRIAEHVLKTYIKTFKQHTWKERGSDERQYGAPGVDLPVCSIMRTKYGEYPEYHTSLDNFEVVSNEGLEGGINIMKKIVETIESNYVAKSKILCEPQLGKRGLYPTLSKDKTQFDSKKLLDVITYCDGKNDVINISEITGIVYEEVVDMIELLNSKDLINIEGMGDILFEPKGFFRKRGWVL